MKKISLFLNYIINKPLFIYWAIIILILSLMSSSSTPQLHDFKIPHFDKIVHFMFYFVLSFLLMLSLKRTKYAIVTMRIVLISVIASTIYGGIIELMQNWFTVDRMADIFDFIANFFGATIGTLLFTVLLKQKKVKFDLLFDNYTL